MAEFESSYKRYQHTLKKVLKEDGEAGEELRGGLTANRFCSSPAGEDWPVRASRPPCLSANRVEVFGAEREPTRSSGDEEGAGETWPGHEDEGWIHLHTNSQTLLVPFYFILFYFTVYSESFQMH